MLLSLAKSRMMLKNALRTTIESLCCGIIEDAIATNLRSSSRFLPRKEGRAPIDQLASVFLRVHFPS